MWREQHSPDVERTTQAHTLIQLSENSMILIIYITRVLLRSGSKWLRSVTPKSKRSENPRGFKAFVKVYSFFPSGSFGLLLPSFHIFFPITCVRV